MYIPDRADLDPINPWRKGFTIQLWMFRGQCARWGHRWRPFFRRLQSYSVALLLDIKPAMFHMKSSEQRPWFFVTFCWLHQQLSSRGHSGGAYSSVVEQHHQTPPRFSSCHRNCNLPGAMRTAEVTNRYSQSDSWLMSDWGDRANDLYFHMLQAHQPQDFWKEWGDDSSACQINKRTYVSPYQSGIVMPMLERWRQKDPWEILTSQQS